MIPFLKIEIDEFANGHDWIITVTNDKKQEVQLLLPKDHDFENDIGPWGLNMVTDGHYM